MNETKLQRGSGRDEEKMSQRKKLLARVHILKKGMAEKNYVALLQEFNCDSLVQLNEGGLQHLVSRMEIASGKAWTKQDKMIFALWNQLFERGKTSSKSVESLNQWIARQIGVGVSGLEQLDVRQKGRVIEALKAWRGRS